MKSQPHVKLAVQIMICILIFLFSTIPSRAITPHLKTDEYLLDHWDTSRGLPSNLIYSIAQTPDGYLWVATYKGLVRYNGLTFTIVRFAKKEEKTLETTPLPECLYCDRDGILWIGSNIGLTSYNYKTHHYQTYTSSHGLSKGTIRRMCKDMQGNLWIGFISDHLNRLSGDTFTTFDDSHGLKGKVINAIVEDQSGNLLVGTRDNGVFKFQEDKFVPYPIIKHKGFLINMFIDRDNALWICTSTGLLKKSGDDITTFNREHGLFTNNSTYILDDNRGSLWISTYESLYRYKKDSIDKKRFKEIFITAPVVCLFYDREGNLWVGTYKKGLFRLRNSKFKSHTPLPELSNEYLFSTHRDRQGNTWIGTDKGTLVRFQDWNTSEYIEVPGLFGSGISSIIVDDEGNLWFGTNGEGVFVKKNRSFLHYTTNDGLVDNLVTAIFQDSRKDIWLGTFDGVSIFHPAGNTFEILDNDNGLSGTKVHSIYEDSDHDIWIATDNGVTVLEDGKTTGEKKMYFLEGSRVTWIYEDPTPPRNEGRVFWITCKGGGLKRLSLKDAQVKTFSVSQGLTTNFIFRFMEDRQDNFWLLSDSGILRIKKSELNRVAREGKGRINCISYGKSEGLSNLEFTNPFPQHTAVVAENGTLCFLGSREIYYLNPDNIRINKTPPSMVIENAFFNNTAIVYPSEKYSEPFIDITHVRFDFNAITLLSADKVTLKYRLEGFDDHWVYLEPGKKREAVYKDLEPGNYTFRVTACNAEGIWNATGASFKFILERSFTKTLLFKVLMLFLVTGLAMGIYLIYRTRKKTLPVQNLNEPEKEQEDVEPRVSSLTDAFAGECLKKLKYLMEVDKVYKDENLTLTLLAQKLKIHRYQLSELLNIHLNRSFPEYINYHRIEEAKRILLSQEGEQKKVTALAQEVGFNTMTAFYKAFKRCTGKTPKEYRKKASQ